MKIKRLEKTNEIRDNVMASHPEPKQSPMLDNVSSKQSLIGASEDLGD